MSSTVTGVPRRRRPMSAGRISNYLLVAIVMVLYIFPLAFLLNTALKSAVDPNAFVWVVVGDAAKVRPQLEKLGMPIEVMPAI